MRFFSTTPLIYIGIFVVATLLSVYLFKSTKGNKDWRKLKYVIFRNYSDYNFSHINKILQELGWERLEEFNENVDLLFSHVNPFISDVYVHLEKLQSHQYLNHIWGYDTTILSKVNLSVANWPYMVQSFRLPQQGEEFLLYAREHPEKRWLQKRVLHREIEMRNVDEIDLTTKDYFVQEFIENPLLIDGYVFDIGVYVAVTSIDPVLMYSYAGDTLVRFCKLKYYPFDANQKDKYVIGHYYKPIWEIPALKKYVDIYHGSMKNTINTYLADEMGIDMDIIWSQIEHIIPDTVLTKEQEIVNALRQFRGRNYFEIVRYDFFVDANLRVYLLEVNKSPNFSSAILKRNGELYEQVLYNMYNLVGIGSPIKHRQTMSFNRSDLVVTHPKNLATNLTVCLENNCEFHCYLEACRLCVNCMTDEEYEILAKANREHLHRIEMRRVFPKPIGNPEEYDIVSEVINMTARNAWLTRWFYGKCLIDPFWCT